MKLLTVDLEHPLPDVPSPAVGEQWVLVRLHRAPLGMLKFPARGCSAAELGRIVADRFTEEIRRHLTADRLCAPTETGAWRVGRRCPQRGHYERPRVTVAVCTRDGAARIDACLQALAAIDYPSEQLDLVVVDNASRDDGTKRLIAERYPRIRCLDEPRPGLDWARNRAILEARGEIVAFTDDDVSVDPGWVDAIARVFVEEPDAQCVTGLVVPDAIDTEAHRQFETYGGFGRGYHRRYYRVNAAAGERAAERHAGAGRFGTGANMAFRRAIFDRIGLFDPALDVGTPTNGGGDLEMFFRVLKCEGTLVYEPTALVRHRHRDTHTQLRAQLTDHGIGLYSYLVRTAQAYPEERRAVMKLGVWWFVSWDLRRLVRSFVRPGLFPRDLVMAEVRGSIRGLRRYSSARAVAQHVLETHGPQTSRAS